MGLIQILVWLRPTINVPNSIIPCYVAMDNFTQHKKDVGIDAAHWQTKHRNKLHVGMVLTGIQTY